MEKDQKEKGDLDDPQPSNEFRFITGERPTFDCLKDSGEALHSKRNILR